MQAVSQCSVRNASTLFLAMVGWVIVAGLAVGLPHADAQEFRVGIVDPQAILKESVYGKRKLAELEDHASARRKVLESDDEELKKLQEKLQASQDAGGDDLTSLQEQLRSKFQKFQQRGQTFQQELDKKQSEMMTEYIEKLKVAAQAVAEQQDFALVTDLNIVLYASQGLDITKEVLKEFEQLYP